MISEIAHMTCFCNGAGGFTVTSAPSGHGNPFFTSPCPTTTASTFGTSGRVYAPYFLLAHETRLAGRLVLPDDSTPSDRGGLRSGTIQLALPPCGAFSARTAAVGNRGAKTARMCFGLPCTRAVRERIQLAPDCSVSCWRTMRACNAISPPGRDTGTTRSRRCSSNAANGLTLCRPTGRLVNPSCGSLCF